MRMVSTAKYRAGEDIGTWVRAVIVNELAIEEGVLKPDARFGHEINSDSLDLIELKLERVFDICISDDDIDGIRTVQDMVWYVEGRLPH